jgi:hypothetical protein
LKNQRFKRENRQEERENGLKTACKTGKTKSLKIKVK